MTFTMLIVIALLWGAWSLHIIDITNFLINFHMWLKHTHPDKRIRPSRAAYLYLLLYAAATYCFFGTDLLFK